MNLEDKPPEENKLMRLSSMNNDDNTSLEKSRLMVNVDQ